MRKKQRDARRILMVSRTFLKTFVFFTDRRFFLEHGFAFWFVFIWDVEHAFSYVWLSVATFPDAPSSVSGVVGDQFIQLLWSEPYFNGGEPGSYALVFVSSQCLLLPPTPEAGRKKRKFGPQIGSIIFIVQCHNVILLLSIITQLDICTYGNFVKAQK